jgi:hypothetical protein
VPPPDETQNVRVEADRSFTWDATVGATFYGVVRGLMGALPIGPGGEEEVCFTGLLAPTFPDPELPDPETGFWYLIRGQSACGAGSYGTASDGTPRTTTTCP